MLADQSNINNRDLVKKNMDSTPTKTHTLICYCFMTVKKKLMCVQNSSRFLV